MKLLAVVVQRNEAFIVQVKFSPEKLIQFMDDPRILGISLKGGPGQHNQYDPNQKPDPADDEQEQEDPDEEEKPVKEVKPPAGY